MSDLEMTRLCAEAMGYKPAPHANRKYSPELMWVVNGSNYNPLTDDAQAMALVKKFGMHISQSMTHGGVWTATGNGVASGATHIDLNRAIVECVAKMQEATNV